MLPNAAQKPILLATMERFNEAATFAAKVGFEAGVLSQPSIHKRCYAEIRERFGLSAQMAVRAIGKAVKVFAGNKTKCLSFRSHGAVTYDQRILSFKGLDKVSLWALGGRMIVPLIYGEYQEERFDRMRGRVDLVYRGGKFFLYSTVDLPDDGPIEPKGFLGVDLGIVNIATDSDGDTYSGEAVERTRQRHQENCRRFQKRGSKGAKKKLKKLAGREARLRKHESHCISKDLVQKAKETDRGNALEDPREFAIGQRFEPRTGIANRGGASLDCVCSWSTRPSSRACRSCWSTSAIRPALARTADIARMATARARPSFFASTAATPRMLISTLP